MLYFSRRLRRGAFLRIEMPFVSTKALSGTTSPLRGSCRLRRGEPTARAQNTLLAECVHFQGLLRRFAPRAAFGGANRHPRITFRSSLLYRSDVVLPLKAQPKKKRNAKAMTQGLLRPFGARAAFGGANRHPRTTVRFPLSHRSDVVLPLKARPKKKRNAKAFLFFLVQAVNYTIKCNR